MAQTKQKVIVDREHSTQINATQKRNYPIGWRGLVDKKVADELVDLGKGARLDEKGNRIAPRKTKTKPAAKPAAAETHTVKSTTALTAAEKTAVPSGEGSETTSQFTAQTTTQTTAGTAAQTTEGTEGDETGSDEDVQTDDDASESDANED